jgi:hypothetical protein
MVIEETRIQKEKEAIAKAESAELDKEVKRVQTLLLNAENAVIGQSG